VREAPSFRSFSAARCLLDLHLDLPPAIKSSISIAVFVLRIDGFRRARRQMERLGKDDLILLRGLVVPSGVPPIQKERERESESERARARAREQERDRGST
jgi:hypothetical protein